MTPEERLIAALKAQNKIIFGTTIGVEASGECTVVGGDGSVRAIAGTEISAGTCVALQTDNGQWYAVSGRESGVIQKKILFRQRNKPLAQAGIGGKVKILYVKNRTFYLGGDRADLLEVYTIPEGYGTIGPASIDNIGEGLDDWIFNIPLKKEDNITLVSVSPAGENSVKNIEIPKVYGGFGDEDPYYTVNDGFSPLFIGSGGIESLFKCFQNGFYTAFGRAIKIRRNPQFNFGERYVTQYVSYYGNTDTGLLVQPVYSDLMTLGVKSVSIGIILLPIAEGVSIVGETIRVSIDIIEFVGGSPTPRTIDCAYTVQSDYETIEDIIGALSGDIGSKMSGFDFNSYVSMADTPSKIIIRGDRNGGDFTPSVTSSAHITLYPPEVVSKAIPIVNSKLVSHYSDTGSIEPVMVLGVFGFDGKESIVVGSAQEYTTAIGAKQESWLVSQKDKVLFIDGTSSKEFDRIDFKNDLDKDADKKGYDLLLPFSRYYPVNLVGNKFFNIALKSLTSTKDSTPIDSIDVFVTDLSKDKPITTKESVSIVSPQDNTYRITHASAYIA